MCSHCWWCARRSLHRVTWLAQMFQLLLDACHRQCDLQQLSSCFEGEEVSHPPMCYGQSSHLQCTPQLTPACTRQSQWWQESVCTAFIHGMSFWAKQELPTWKHSQYFFLQWLFLQWQPRLCRPPTIMPGPTPSFSILSWKACTPQHKTWELRPSDYCYTLPLDSGRDLLGGFAASLVPAYWQLGPCTADAYPWLCLATHITLIMWSRTCKVKASKNTELGSKCIPVVRCIHTASGSCRSACQYCPAAKQSQ